MKRSVPMPRVTSLLLLHTGCTEKRPSERKTELANGWKVAESQRLF